MTSQVTHYKDGMKAYTDAEGLKVIRDKSKRYGYKIIKIEEKENHTGYIVTMLKIKHLKHYDPIK